MNEYPEFLTKYFEWEDKSTLTLDLLSSATQQNIGLRKKP